MRKSSHPSVWEHQGTVLSVKHPSQPFEIAVKFHLRDVAYRMELGAYFRMQDLEIDQVRGHDVPLLLGHDDELQAEDLERSGWDSRATISPKLKK